MRKFKGFTLSEIMVALAVIGVLAAVVTPVIVQTKPNKNKMMVKKSFYTTEQIVSSLINDEQLYPDMRENCDNGVDDTADAYCAWGFDYDNAVKYEGMEYKGAYKFAGLFKEKLNVAQDIASSKDESSGPDSSDFYPIFYTTDGIKWDLTSTKSAWTSKQSKVGTFGNQTNAAGIGSILIDVNGDAAPNCRQNGKPGVSTDGSCTASAKDFDRYVIQILASGKLRIHTDDARAVEWATINTAVKDSM